MTFKKMDFHTVMPKTVVSAVRKLRVRRDRDGAEMRVRQIMSLSFKKFLEFPES